MQRPAMRYETVRLDSLIPYAGNAKLHPEKQVERIGESIERFGYNDPIAVWRNGSGEFEVVEGHGRLLAMQRAGIESAEVIVLDGLTDEQRRAYTHAHNRIAMETGYDRDALANEIEGLGEADLDFLGIEIAPRGTQTRDVPDGDHIVCPRCGHRLEA